MVIFYVQTLFTSDISHTMMHQDCMDIFKKKLKVDFGHDQKRQAITKTNTGARCQIARSGKFT
jgi:hypothetical protein